MIVTIIASGDWWQRTIGYKIIGNEIWRFLLLLLVVLVAMAVGRIVQFAINNYAGRRDKKRGLTALTLFLRCLTKPISVAFFALGLYLCKLCLVFEDKTAVPVVEGIRSTIEKGWTKIAQAVAAIALAYALYRLVDIIEQDTSISIKSLTRRYGVSYDFIRRRLADTRWTTKRLARRGLANQYGWGARCDCGFVLADGETACKWCRLQKDHGITDYHGLLEVGAI